MVAGDSWIRDGGRVCLDFVNTLLDRGCSPRETLPAPPELVGWLAGAGLLAAPGAPAGPPAAEEGLLTTAHRLREAIDRTVLTVRDGRLPAHVDVEVINEAGTAAPAPVRQLVVADDELAPGSATREAGDPAAALGLVAQDAIDLVLTPAVRRVRVCGGERCALRFLDRSPAHNRRWCSMARCGNRVKARRHQARHGAARA
ncbi:CGNR zinc finger domain-containing protein [Streptomyces sp. NPDC127098]|uniref:CGNR zinc finger domain-containing protein n=1 Tax=Streptomyces sp. NPDC127098 TaxID=3347137 RepID=UPI00365EADB4